MTKRAGNGDGSIRSRETKTKGIVWDVQMTGRDRRGLAVRGGKRGFPTQKAAQAWRDEQKRLARLGKSTKAVPLKMADLCEEYIKARPKLARSTVRGYESVLRLHIKPRLDVRAAQLTKARVQEWVYESQELLESQGRTGSGTVKQGVRLIRAAMRWAASEEMGLLPYNPVAGMSIIDPTRTREGRAFTKKQLRSLFEHSDEVSGLLWFFLFETSARKGEILAVDWEDLDLDSGELLIDRIATPESHYRRVERRTKGKKERVVPLSKALVARLRARKQELGASATGALFVAARGGRAYDSTIFNWWERDMKAAGLEDLVPHELRHTWASMAVRKGADIKVVSEILGHKRVSTTADIYLHTTKRGKRSAIESVYTAL